MERIGDDVRRELGRFGNAGAMADIVSAWPAAVGQTVAANAWPARLGRDGTLHVATSSSAWAFELTQLVDEVAARLRESLGDTAPASFRFAPGPLPEAAVPPADERSKPRLEPTLAQAREARAWAAAIEPEELRKTVEKAARASLARASSDRSVW
jgi:hypothetical protein